MWTVTIIQNVWSVSLVYFKTCGKRRLVDVVWWHWQSRIQSWKNMTYSKPETLKHNSLENIWWCLPPVQSRVQSERNTSSLETEEMPVPVHEKKCPSIARCCREHPHQCMPKGMRLANMDVFPVTIIFPIVPVTVIIKQFSGHRLSWFVDRHIDLLWQSKNHFC